MSTEWVILSRSLLCGIEASKDPFLTPLYKDFVMKIREPKPDKRKHETAQERLCRIKGDSIIERATLHSVSRDVGKIVIDPKTGLKFRVMA